MTFGNILDFGFHGVETRTEYIFHPLIVLVGRLAKLSCDSLESSHDKK